MGTFYIDLQPRPARGSAPYAPYRRVSGVNRTHISELTPGKTSTLQVGSEHVRSTQFSWAVDAGATEAVCVPLTRESAAGESKLEFFCSYMPEHVCVGKQKHCASLMSKRRHCVTVDPQYLAHEPREMDHHHPGEILEAGA